MILTPEQILSPASTRFSIIDRIDELRERGVAVDAADVDQRVRDILAMSKSGIPVETSYRKLLFGLEWLEYMVAPKDSLTALATFLIIGDDPYYLAAWRYELKVRNPFYQHSI